MKTKWHKKWLHPKDVTLTGGPGKGWVSLQKSAELFFTHRKLVLILFLVLCVALSGIHYVRSLLTSSTVVSMEYEEAARGLTPSQTRFNIYEIQSAEVMERLIDYAGLQGDINAEELAMCIRVGATHSRNVSGNENFISTSYMIEFTNSEKIQKRSAETMLSLLCKAYREFFVEHYGVNHSILSFDINDLRFNDEYLLAADLLELKSEQLRKYVQLCRRSNKNYRDPDTGITFSELEQRIDNFSKYDLARLRSYIIENGIANDKSSLNAMMDYKIRMDRLVYSKLMAAYDEDNKGIKIYDTAMSAVVMIPTEDATMRYYMSRTKTGMDNLALHADAQLLGAMEKTTDIEYKSYLIQKMQANTPTQEQREKADAMILQMAGTLETLAGDIRTVDSSFASYKARNYLSFQNNHQRFLQRIAPGESLGIALLVLAAAFVTVFLRNLIKRDKMV